MWNNSHAPECQRQHISPDLTEYTWELSRDGGQSFETVTLETAFTSTDVKVLESVYLSPGVLARCTARAVDSTHTKGNSRVSAPVHLSASSRCNGTGEMEAALVSYQSFRAAPEVRPLIVYLHNRC